SGVSQTGSNSISLAMAQIQTQRVLIYSPVDGAVVNSRSITVTGGVNNNAQVTVNGVAAIVSGYDYSATITLAEGANTITAVATDAIGQEATKTINVTCTVSGNVA